MRFTMWSASSSTRLKTKIRCDRAAIVVLVVFVASALEMIGAAAAYPSEDNRRRVPMSSAFDVEKKTAKTGSSARRDMRVTLQIHHGAVGFVKPKDPFVVQAE